ncbi:response regulator transcription factor [Actinoplanes sp. N902-109]|uniref:response regulator transcription factor n=1 Tax=Actinoplanes sp. (strain N902-109) TaxID=649831 RepID=UPI0003294C77|nr:response regulator transcription factor [Actinoplanes sp. N902-109]AGL16224.1 winged helix family two component transcriptional regulator [Actinoplanes sp. N902-109]
MVARVLVVEDEDAIRDPLAAALRAAGHEVRACADGTGFEDVVDSFRPDLALLDVHLPGGRDGFELARALGGRSDCAVLLVTARDSVADRLTGFGAGADDYVVKPFVTVEVLARVAAVLRRLGRVPSTVQVADLIVDEGAQLASRADHALSLTGTEFKLLAYLAGHRGRILSKTQLLTQVWGYDEYDPNLVEVHVSALRRKLELHGPRLIHTARGLGYVLRP